MISSQLVSTMSAGRRTTDVVMVIAAVVLVGTVVALQAVFARTAEEFVIALITKHCWLRSAQVLAAFLAPEDVVALVAFYEVAVRAAVHLVIAQNDGRRGLDDKGL